MSIKKKYPFYFDLPPDEFLEEMNRELPIKINKMRHLIDRIHEKYPLIDRNKIGIIVKTAFIVLRNCLVAGYLVEFSSLVNMIGLHFFINTIGGGFWPAVKIRMSAPKKMKRYQNDEQARFFQDV